ncbi:MAG: hypothetical protein J7K61_03140 [Thermoplasmata archaeon]|nr:hypothetical protein [Thermoplasmata archaeon]
MKPKYKRYLNILREHMDVWGYKAIIFSIISGLVVLFVYLKVDKNVAIALIAVFYIPLGNWLLKNGRKWRRNQRNHLPQSIRIITFIIKPRKGIINTTTHPEREKYNTIINIVITAIIIL